MVRESAVTDGEGNGSSGVDSSRREEGKFLFFFKKIDLNCLIWSRSGRQQKFFPVIAPRVLYILKSNMKICCTHPYLHLAISSSKFFFEKTLFYVCSLYNGKLALMCL